MKTADEKTARWCARPAPAADPRDTGAEPPLPPHDEAAPYADLGPLLGWDHLPELMRVLDE